MSVLKDESQCLAALNTEGFIARLPSNFGLRAEYPRDLIGATIVRFGTFSSSRSRLSNRLVVDYTPLGSKEEKRVVFDFCDEAIWIEG